MTEPGDISDLVYADRRVARRVVADRYVPPVAIALAAREAGPGERHAPPSSWKISSPARSARGASWPMPAPQTATVTAATMVNCFVQPAIDPGLGWPQGLDAALARAVRTMSMGGGVG